MKSNDVALFSRCCRQLQRVRFRVGRVALCGHTDLLFLSFSFSAWPLSRSFNWSWRAWKPVIWIEKQRCVMWRNYDHHMYVDLSMNSFVVSLLARCLNVIVGHIRNMYFACIWKWSWTRRIKLHYIFCDSLFIFCLRIILRPSVTACSHHLCYSRQFVVPSLLFVDVCWSHNAYHCCSHGYLTNYCADFLKSSDKIWCYWATWSQKLVEATWRPLPHITVFKFQMKLL